MSADTAFDVSSATVQTPTISFEFFQPKDTEGEQKLWQTIDELQEFKPDFVSMTYGAGGGTRDRTVRIAAEFIAKTGVPVIGHLTCVGSTRDELIDVLEQYKSEGFHGVLALRGDPVGGPTAPWITTPGGFDYADQLVELADDLLHDRIRTARHQRDARDGRIVGGGDGQRLDVVSARQIGRASCRERVCQYV